MKAVIIYDDVASAARSVAILRRTLSLANVSAEWNIKPWCVDVLSLPMVADEALLEALDADIMVLAGPRVYSLSPSLNQWLESWGNRRQAADCALVVVREGTDGRDRAPDPALSIFAERHDLDFIVEHNTLRDDEFQRPSPPCAKESLPCIELRNS